MFCPQCGQQQVSPEVRFCSRCGFQLHGVASLLATGGALPSTESAAAAGESPRRRGVRQGVMIFFIGVVVTAVMAILAEYNPRGVVTEALGLLSAAIFILGGLLRAVYALIFAGGKPQPQQQRAPLYAPPAGERLAGHDASALPPAQSVPANAYAPPRARTAEIAPPPSVTENTTRLLQDTADDNAAR